VKVLVTGGAGYVGSHLVQRLRQAGHTIRVLDVAPVSRRVLTDPGCELIQGSIADLNLVTQAMQGSEAVCHLAWGFHPSDDRQEIHANLFGTLNLLEAALKARVQHFLFASTAVVYGPTEAGPVDEEYPCYPERSAIGGPVYGITKLACEKLCLVYQRRGLPVTVFRMHGVFGDHHLSQFAHMIEQVMAGEPVKAIREAGGEYVHPEDVLRGFLLAIGNEKAYGQVFNVAGSYTYRDPELARYVVEATGSQSSIELIEDPTNGMISVSVDKLRRVLGYKPKHGEFLSRLIRNAILTRKRQEPATFARHKAAE